MISMWDKPRPRVPVVCPNCGYETTADGRFPRYQCMRCGRDWPMPAEAVAEATLQVTGRHPGLRSMLFVALFFVGYAAGKIGGLVWWAEFLWLGWSTVWAILFTRALHHHVSALLVKGKGERANTLFAAVIAPFVVGTASNLTAYHKTCSAAGDSGTIPIIIFVAMMGVPWLWAWAWWYGQTEDERWCLGIPVLAFAMSASEWGVALVVAPLFVWIIKRVEPLLVGMWAANRVQKLSRRL